MDTVIAIGEGAGVALACGITAAVPLAVAALNTGVAEASARLFWRVLAETIGRGADSCRPMLARSRRVTCRSFDLDSGPYPLGSCTMKHNPRVNERVVNLPGFRDLHPLQEEDGSQGALELMWRLQGILAEVAGLPAVSLQPAAGSQGELTGLMLMRAYFADQGEGETRRKIVIPDTAHGTNPASVTMAGYELTHVRTDGRGNIDLDDLRTKVDEETAALIARLLNHVSYPLRERRGLFGLQWPPAMGQLEAPVGELPPASFTVPQPDPALRRARRPAAPRRRAGLSRARGRHRR